MPTILYLRHCNKHCKHYHWDKKMASAICDLGDYIKVTPRSPCKYELLTHNSEIKFIAPEEILLRGTFGEGLDMTLEEARAQLTEEPKVRR